MAVDHLAAIDHLMSDDALTQSLIGRLDADTKPLSSLLDGDQFSLKKTALCFACDLDGFAWYARGLLVHRYCRGAGCVLSAME